MFNSLFKNEKVYDENVDVVNQNISFFNVPIRPFDLKAEHVSKLKNNLDKVLSPRLNDPAIAKLCEEYADSFYRLSTYMCNLQYLEEYKKAVEHDAEQEAISTVEKIRKDRKDEFFKFDNEMKEKKREMEANDKKEELNLRNTINRYRRQIKMNRFMRKGRNDKQSNFSASSV